MKNYSENFGLNIPPGVVDPADEKPEKDLILINRSLECRNHSTPRGSQIFRSFSALDNYEANGE